ncbi:MAG: hypothetical protein M1820_001473 [Bogoriella megaspora]|nr:MAG: hypothetical protein M1820_001473 [Bogoriella megaspora]
MDHRQQQQPARPPERGLVHNPNHPQPPLQPPSFAQYPAPPPVTSAPVHIPYTNDPFPRRDPFLGSSQNNRHDSYGYQHRETGTSTVGDRGGWSGGATATAAHHSQPPSASATNAPEYMSHPYDTSRRSSLGAGTPSHQYGGPLDPPPPPPPALGGRTMLPPSPSQQSNANSFSNPLSRGAPPPPPPSFGAARDLASLNAAHRPGSSMTISSMLGSDAPAHHHASSNPLAANVPLPQNSTRPMQPPSPRRSSSTFGQYGQNIASDKQYSSNGSRSDGTPSASTASPIRQTKPSSPEFLRAHQPSLSQSSAALGFRSFQAPPHEAHERPEIYQSSSSMPPRPNSQPTGPRETFSSPARAARPDPNVARFYHDASYDSRQRIQEEQNQNANRPDFRNHGESPVNSRARANTMQPTAPSPFSPPRDRQPPFSLRDYSRALSQQTDWSPPHLDRRENTSRENPSDIFRPSFNGQSVNSRLPSADLRTFSDESKPYRIFDRFGDRRDSAPFGTGPSPEHSHTSNPASVLEQPSRIPSFEHRVVLSEEPIHQQRSLLNISPELNRSRARGSPLPQAVQGAQPHRPGPGDGPGVKHEFGRMFSGLGSGVGSNTPIAGMTANGSSTPSRQTPTRSFEDFDRANQVVDLEQDGAKLAREVSRGGRKGRKFKDEDNPGSDSGDGRATPGFSGSRGRKKAKTSHPSRHHHVTAHNHQYVYNVFFFSCFTDSRSHHHAQHADDELSFAGSTSSMQGSGTPYNSHKINSYQSQPVFSTPSSQPHHHHGHHHHHAQPHHHHHAPKTHNSTAPARRKTQTRILSQSVLNSVSHLQRQHLGSSLYSPRVSVPSTTTTSAIDIKQGYTSRARPLPRFDGRSNCTFTIRVPRYYLSPSQREAVCGSRYIWGSEIYTDDSDPLAACIHGGWIRGDWGDEVDSDLLLEQPLDEAEESPDVLTDPPTSSKSGGAGPYLPQQNRDLHITVVILPPLEDYASTTACGIKSRAWGKNHDGMSFKILKLEWVDEGPARAEERGAKGRKMRLAGRRKLMEDNLMFSGMGKVVEVA